MDTCWGRGRTLLRKWVKEGTADYPKLVIDFASRGSVDAPERKVIAR